MELSKNDKIELNINALTSEGSGVGRYNGLAVFVRGTAVKDRIIAHIIKRSKKYAVGIIDEILSPSPERIESSCPYSKQCGGCSFRHISYEEELKYKLSRVNDALERIGHLDIRASEIIGADNTDHYRNKAQYPVSVADGKLTAGFYAYKSHRIIPCADCMLQPKEFENGIKAFSKWIKENNVTSYNENTGKGLLRHIYFRKGFVTGDIMACAVINGNKIPNENRLIKLLKEQLGDNLKTVAININKENTNVILGKNTAVIYGDEHITDKLLGKTFAISPNSFYQVNHDQCEKLYSKAIELADLRGSETLLDLYCGVGTIGISMADKVKKLVGIEIIPQAVDNAKLNAEINNIENAEFICADAPKGADILKKHGIKPDIIVIDPPRKGCDKALFDTIEEMSPDKIIYVSCDSATLARDLEILEAKNYTAEKIVAVDMFPRTPHVETVVLLSKKQSNL
ncbi:MAG: 23S rRNA (uracil(1939)-C(5))-methyltransferase RlmD [Acetobacter sp.]|nr:23S rRNA (uracil(1939)-C(5))-methyltransferase RlmD [Bacteroides sp.]MCM1341076.1 23S rRNA (uracil(1939)-C(5))-methyltransferase RlmD [Acetobacter sp.]MCM1433591.1 23S rRNA (uracil(1939)-C(5))-methyltransferase RlmD [Clostridiales bacterium]